ncbi:MAG TPA: TIGR04282 family arsenosugar biosynthesis glycosyltransferase [Chloroflexota bacterium]|nr:TIGR04282 family arsenosugar biosynthesis glycosyltransferase [Chloroflexota bacterium]
MGISAARAVIAVMAKAPIPGVVKTRLVARLGVEGAADLAARFLADTLATAREVPGAELHVVCPDETQRQALIELVPRDVAVVAQAEPGLMAGLAWALAWFQARGAAKVLLIDGDSPTLPATLLVEARAALDAVDVCVGPCPDGGYYLIGARRECRGLFDGVVASTANTGAQTIARARSIGLSTRLLSPWPDVDTPEDFADLLAQLRGHPGVAPATRDWLTHNGWLAE